MSEYVRFERLFCADCKRYTVHEQGLAGDYKCIHKHEKQEDALDKWTTEREIFRSWLASLDWMKLMDLSKDIALRLDYESARMNQEAMKEKFRKLAS